MTLFDRLFRPSEQRPPAPPRRLAAPMPLINHLMARRFTGQRPGHRVSSAHLQAAYPFVAEGGLGGRGVLIGRDAYGGSFVYDAWELYRAGLITSPNMIVVGFVGSAKSSLVKTLLWRSHVFGRRAWVVDVKREYGPLAEAIGGTTVALRPGGNVRLNPLTPLAGREGQQRLLRAVCTATLGRPLLPEESAALMEGLISVIRHKDGEPTLPDIVEVLLRPTGEMADALATEVGALATAAREAALALARLCAGDLRGMFDGPTSGELDFDAPLVVLDLAEVYNSEALAVLMTCATAWMQANVDARRAEARLLGQTAPKTIGVVDETWRVFAELGLGEWLQSNFKLARQYGQQNVIVVHRLSDLRAAGAEGSREARLAEGLLGDAETRVIYRQPEDQVPLAVELLGLTETEAELLPTLGKGQALWKVGQRSFLVQHQLSGLEWQIVDTDSAMNVTSMAEEIV